VNIWLIMLLGGLLTFGMRLSFIYLMGRVDVPDMVRRGLRFVPPAVLSALVLPELIMPSGHLDLSFGNPRWLAGLVAILTAWRTRSTLLTILAGMAALLVLQLLLP
jgi:branched-subunit amino acid transport protein